MNIKKTQAFFKILFYACLVFFLARSGPLLAGEMTDALQDRAVHEKRFLKASGTVIKDRSGQGQEVLLRGVNLGSLFLIEPWILGLSDTDNPPIEDEATLRDALRNRFGDTKCEQVLDRFYNTFIQNSDLNQIKDLGINAVRLPISYRMLQNENGSWIRTRSGDIDFSQIDRIVNACAARNIYVLLDLHGAPGSQNKERHSGKKNYDKLLERSSKGEAYRRQTAELWEAIARHYRDNANICGYDLLNEPREPFDASSREILWRFYDRIYKAIRAVDPDHIIMMEAVWDWDSLPSPAHFGWKNVVYQFHYYNVLENKDLEEQKAFMDQKIQQGKLKQTEHQVPVMVGEFTCLDFMTTWRHYLESFNQAKWSWTMWTYKSYPVLAWAIYSYSGSHKDLPRFRTDSFEDLLLKMSRYATPGNYARNDELANTIRDHAFPHDV